MDNILINIEALNERTDFDNELAEDLLMILKNDVPKYNAQLIKSLDDSDFKEIATVLHKMKSAVALFGFDNIKLEIELVEKNALSFCSEFDYLSKINRIFITLNNHMVELEKILKE